MSGSSEGRIVLERDTWLVENFKNPKEIQTLKDGQMKHKVQVRDCAGLSLQVEGKLNSLIVDSCADCRICVASLIATVEIVNSQKIKLQVTGCVPAVSIDKSQKVDIFVSHESRGVEITSSKSTEMNLNVPKAGEDGDWTEIVIPEQFHHKLNPDGKLHTRVSDLYSC
ncbi:adenylyl cyclase associated protein, putative [Eimeria tenella]|uniref:Adenylyl cyclase associated protein, putative n=1 Tax=Eimeria tenella TaxID=5802 RepID=U6KUB0_EIMTE|nr:adenylyl cyclase associated protein, putative [Eimeria tenella]CDJ39095.1 adenylyl cyclase associated protein, putative [Eimeria tenella]|eukprot:XP_013229850.1 adenylyl cyclase associated protein, putative [Eimeria tenella]